MIRTSRLVVAIFALLAAGQVFSQARELPDFTDLVEKQGPAVVNISTTQTLRRQDLPQVPQVPQLDENDPLYDFFRRFIPRQQPGPRGREPESRSLGSGFVISADGYILTNAHVVEGANEINVRFNDKREFKAKVIGADRRTDVALIKIEASGLPVVKFGDPMRLRVGEWVLAIGSPFGFENSVTAGIVSAKGRALPQENFVPFIQTDVAINPGNSGGPLFNMKGEVVGINSQIYSRTGGFMGLSFAIPIDVALDVQNQLRSKGRVSRGRIGVVIQEVTKELADSFGLQKPAGALVNQVETGSPADKAGIEALDVIVKFDGKTIEASNDLPRVVGATRPGSRVAVQVLRKGVLKDLTVTVGELQEDRIARGDAPRGAKPAEAAANRLGLVVSELTAEHKRELKLQNGLMVSSVRPEVRGDIRPGDVLLTLVHKGQQTELRSVEQMNKLLAGLDKNATITLHLRRGDSTAFVTINGLPDKG